MPLSDSPVVDVYSSLSLQNFNTIRDLAAPEDDLDALRLIDLRLRAFELEAYADTSALDAENRVRDTIQALELARELKASVVAASLTNVDLTEIAPVIDGVQTEDGSRIALVGQTDSTENGIYTVTVGGLVRATDADTTDKLPPNTAFRVNEGTLAGHLFYLANDTAPVLGDDDLIFVDQSPVVANAGSGLTYDPQTNAYDVGGTQDRILVDADSVDISPAYDAWVQSTVDGAIAPVNDTLQWIQDNYQPVSTLNSVIDAAIEWYVQSTEMNAILTDGVTQGITRTFTIGHPFNTRRIAPLVVINPNTGKVLKHGVFAAPTLNEVTISFTGADLPPDNVYWILFRKF